MLISWSYRLCKCLTKIDFYFYKKVFLYTNQLNSITIISSRLHSVDDITITMIEWLKFHWLHFLAFNCFCGTMHSLVRLVACLRMVLRIYSTIDQMPLCIDVEFVCYGWRQRFHNAVKMPVKKSKTKSMLKWFSFQPNQTTVWLIFTLYVQLREPVMSTPSDRVPSIKQNLWCIFFVSSPHTRMGIPM